MFIFRNLYVKFSLLLIVVIVILSLGLYGQYAHSRSIAQENTRKIAELSVLALKSEIEGWMLDKTRVIHDAASLIVLTQERPQETLLQLKALLKNNEAFSSLYFGSVDNRMINASGWQPPPGFDLRRRPWYVSALAQNQLVITEAFLNASKDDVIVTIAKPVYTQTGTLLGVMAGDVSVRKIMQTVQEMQQPAEFGFLIDGNHKLLAQTERAFRFQTDPSVLDAEFQSIVELSRKNETGSFLHKINDQSGFVAFQKVAGTHWTLGNHMKLDSFVKADEQLKWALSITLAGTLALLLILFFLLGRYVVSPLLALNESVGKIDMEVSPEYRIPAMGGEEFGKLANTFNQVLDKAAYYLAQLQENERLVLNREKKLIVAEAALLATQAANQAMLKAIPDLMFMLKKDGTFLDYKAAAEPLLLTPEQFLGKNVAEVFPPNIAESVLQAIQNAYATGTLQSFEYTLEMGGESRHYEARLVICGEDQILAICRNISERKRMQAELQASEQRYRSLMMQAYDAVLLLDLETLEIVEANAAFEKLTGYRVTPEQPLSVFTLMVDEPVNVMRYLDEIHTTGVLHPAVRKIRTREGRTLFVERTGNRLQIGARQYQLTTFRDVTQERLHQQQLQKELLLASQLQQALLPPIPRSGYFRISTVFEPQGFVSGDVYCLEWTEANKILRGFLLDLTGHGMATALQTAAVSVLLHQVMDLPQESSLTDRLVWLNHRIPRYIDESTFAAAVGFELDFVEAQLRYASAGINHFLINGERVDVAGLYLGIREEESYELHCRPLRPGDAVCFMTDGISDIFDREGSWGTVGAGELCRLFHEGDWTKKTQDDSTAICIEVR